MHNVLCANLCDFEVTMLIINTMVPSPSRNLENVQ